MTTLAELNPAVPSSALDDARRKLTRPGGSTLEVRNRAFHRMLVNGVEVEYQEEEGLAQSRFLKRSRARLTIGR